MFFFCVLSIAVTNGDLGRRYQNTHHAHLHHNTNTKYCFFDTHIYIHTHTYIYIHKYTNTYTHSHIHNYTTIDTYIAYLSYGWQVWEPEKNENLLWKTIYFERLEAAGIWSIWPKWIPQITRCARSPPSLHHPIGKYQGRASKSPSNWKFKPGSRYDQ